MIWVGGRAFELIQEHKDAWKPEAFKERYSEVLDRYDYIVGDWGYNQLRLKGFFKEGNSKATKDSVIASLQDYLQEYCNFGCAYFVLERQPAKGLPPEGAGPEEPAAPAEAEAAPPSEEADEAGAKRIAGVAGGMAFSDRRPYSWREHQSPARSSRAAERAAAAAEREAEQAARAEAPGGGQRRDGGPDRRDGRPYGGRPHEGKARIHGERHEDGRGGPRGDRKPYGGASEQQRDRGGHRPQQGGGPGGGRKFPKGPRPEGQSGGPPQHKGGHRGGKPEGGAPREQHAGGGRGGQGGHGGHGGPRDRQPQHHHSQQRHQPKPAQP
ncbi:YutD family protein [Paenibacillus sp.]|uniref:YutD family protein n=1 Tax=Paenibacillus sp. TaxID=58172 RepID=UPI002D2E90F5|nr:YutD-like domain-containing protein [Paenibacillus sp.]HZG84590.1 YutD-like domain-containing protein [Paenibacillus sp.]